MYLNDIKFCISVEKEVNMIDACGSDPLIITIFNTTDITSPNFPNPYPNNLHCTWMIVAEVDKRVLLNVKGYEIEHKYRNITFNIKYSDYV